ncbi:MAG: quinone-dependent dihydroorotate dehydrogenase [Hyphomonadaceae bacterium]|nr:quinone-dependent dihydroorotate dehydrogenase [Hyphomonadaceae bacterium]
MSLPDLALPLVKKLSPEAAHSATISGLKLGIGLPKISPDRWGIPVELPKSGLHLANPVGLAAGFDKNADVHSAMARFGFGFLECGTVTPKPQPGNPKPRLFRLTEDDGVINRMGFNNHGLDYFVRRLRRAPPRPDCPVGANVGANKTSDDFIADYETGIAAVYPYGSYLTINISSPNTPGLRGLQGKAALQELLTRCGAACSAARADAGAEKPAFLKIAPDLDDAALADIVDTVRGEGAWLSGLIVSNTTLDRPASLRSAHASESGGLSGAPLMEKSTRVLKDVASELFGDFDLIGCGGISSGADAYAKIRAGAHAVQLYSALSIHGPGLVAKVNADLAERLHADGFSSVAEAAGADLPSRA